MLHDADLVEAILDRVLERGRVLQFKGPSYRTRHLRIEGGSEVSRKGVPDFRAPTRGLPKDLAHGASIDLGLFRHLPARESRLSQNDDLVAFHRVVHFQ